MSGCRTRFSRPCKECGKIMQNVAPNRLYCPECARRRTNEQARRHYHEEYAALKRASTKKTVQQRYDEHVAEVSRLEAIGGSYGKGRLKLWLAEQKEKPSSVTSTEGPAKG